MNAAQLIVKCLENEGVEYVFGIPGEENEALMLALKDSTIKFILTRHEQAAAFMANVYGRLTGKAGVCLATLGPGATNLITGLSDAYLDKSPVVALTGQAETYRLGKEAHQLLDVCAMLRPVTRWTHELTNPQTIPENIRKAFKLAQEEKPSVTHFSIPQDLAKSEVGSLIVLPVRKVKRPTGDLAVVEALIELLKNAKKPLILAGNGAIRKRSAKDLTTLCTLLNIPVISTFMGKGALSDKSPLSLRTFGGVKKDDRLAVFEEADLVIAVGFDLTEIYPETLELMKLSAKKLVHIDFTSAEVYQNYLPDLEIVGDISNTLKTVIQVCVKEQMVEFEDWSIGFKRKIEKEIVSGTRVSKEQPITVNFLLHKLRQVLRSDDILLSDVGAHKIAIAKNWTTYKPGSVIISNGLASMGIALPGAIAAKLVHPTKHVVAIMGDGGFLMNSQEIETAKRLGLAFTIIVLRDDKLGLIAEKQLAHQGDTFGVALSNPDFVKYGHSFGINGYRVSKPEELELYLTKCVSNNQLNLLEVDLIRE